MMKTVWIKIRSFFGHRKLRFDILTSFIFLFVSFGLLMLLYTYQGTKQISVHLAHQLLKQTGDTTHEKVSDYLGSSKEALTFTRALINGQSQKITDDMKLRKNLIKILELYPAFTVISVALTNGDYLSIERATKDSKYVTNTDKPLLENIKFLSQYQNRSPVSPEGSATKELEKWLYFDKDGNIIGQEDNPFLVYDARKRPWYLQTEQKRRFNWTPVYMFSYLNVPGLTASVPLLSTAENEEKFQGVIGIDVSLTEISTFLQKNKPSENGMILITNESNQLVASTDPSHMMPVNFNNDQVINIVAVKDEYVRKAYHYYNDLKKDQFEFELNQKNYLASFLKVSNRIDSDWLICIVVPEDDFTAAAKDIRRNVMLLVLLSLAICTYLIFILARKIAVPIIAVANETERMHNLDLSHELSVKSNIFEIQMMLKSLASMKTSLVSFNKFIPQTLIKKLLQKGTEVKLGGNKKDLTIFFSDIANFTSISETMTPEKLVEHLSLYFDELSHIITENNGTIDKYIGDSIMAFWGAPLHDKDQTYNACHTALRCQKRLSELNRQWELEGKPIFKTRIGVHRDDVLVGIIGSREKMNYTLIGDGVNAASRLEGLNKAYGSLILVSENIVSHVEEHFLFRPLDIIAVKGKKKPMHIFELVAQYKEDSTLLPTREQKELCDAFTSAFKLYTLRRFEDALKAFQEIHGHFPHDAATEVFIKRCEDFIKNPPPPEWEGFMQATTK